MKKISLFISVLIIIFYSCEDKKPTESPDDPKETIIPKSTKIIDIDEATDHFLSVSDDSTTFIFNSDILSTTDLNENDIMILNHGEGFIKKITEINNANNQVVVKSIHPVKYIFHSI